MSQIIKMVRYAALFVFAALLTSCVVPYEDGHGNTRNLEKGYYILGNGDWINLAELLDAYHCSTVSYKGCKLTVYALDPTESDGVRRVGEIHELADTDGEIGYLKLRGDPSALKNTKVIIVGKAQRLYGFEYCRPFTDYEIGINGLYDFAKSRAVAKYQELPEC